MNEDKLDDIKTALDLCLDAMDKHLNEPGTGAPQLECDAVQFYPSFTSIPPIPRHDPEHAAYLIMSALPGSLCKRIIYEMLVRLWSDRCEQKKSFKDQAGDANA